MSEECDYDVVRVAFSDGTSTVLPVLAEDEIVDAIVEMCERDGYDLLEVEDYAIE